MTIGADEIATSDLVCCLRYGFASGNIPLFDFTRSVVEVKTDGIEFPVAVFASGFGFNHVDEGTYACLPPTLNGTRKLLG
jgi:hypothetical protein